MIPIDIQVSRSMAKVKGQAYSSYAGEGGISVLPTSIFENYYSTRIVLFHTKYKRNDFSLVSAFPENNASSSSIHYSPTPCLKIRNMFDADV